MPSAGDVFEGKTVTEVYTGFEEAVYRETSGTSSMLLDRIVDTPWFDVRDDIRSVEVVDEGIAPTSMRFWFLRLENMTACDISRLDVSKTDSFFCLFARCLKMQDVKLPEDLDGIVDFGDAFYYCQALQELDLGSVATGPSRSFWRTFTWCASLESLLLPAQICGTYPGYCFFNCHKLAYDASGWILGDNPLEYPFNSGAPGVIAPTTTVAEQTSQARLPAVTDSKNNDGAEPVYSEDESAVAVMPGTDVRTLASAPAAAALIAAGRKKRD